MAVNPPSSYPSTPPRIRFDTIGEGFRWFQDQTGTWIVTALIAGIIYVVVYFGSVVVYGLAAGGFQQAPGTMPSGGGLAVSVLMWIVFLFLISFLWGGLARMSIRQLRGEPIAPGDLFSAADLTPRIAGAYLVASIATSIGIVFCIIPGLIIGGLLMLSVPLIVDQNAGAMESLTRSWDALKNDWLNAGAYYLLLIVMNVIGAIPCGLGLLVTVPVTMLGIAGIYRDFFLGGPAPSGLESFQHPQGGTTAPPYQPPQTPPQSYQPPYQPPPQPQEAPPPPPAPQEPFTPPQPEPPPAPPENPPAA